MNAVLSCVTLSIIAILAVFTEAAVPPHVCHANFRWEDCGRPPLPVVYYWKPGSRCEVGIWRGCLPNVNMFRDEYECVSTCVFSVRAEPDDFHNQNEMLSLYDTINTEDTTTAMDFTDIIDNNATDSDSTDAEDVSSSDIDVTADITNDEKTEDSSQDGSTTEAGAAENTADNGTTEAKNPDAEQEPDKGTEQESRKSLKGHDDHFNHS